LLRRRAIQRYKKTDKGVWAGRKAHLWAKYKITPEQYDWMFKAQNGVCAICGKPETLTRNGKLVHLSVDHCHVTGKVRGLLCSEHNKMLGHAEDSVEVLAKAISYLTRYMEN
jgi:hypothetical protein